MNKVTVFISLSNSYALKNKYQELICLYQARFIASQQSDLQMVKSIEEQAAALESEGIHVPATSVIILSYNTLKFTKQCLESVKNTVDLDRNQIVVVDNASTDGSVEYLRSLDWITLIENHENRGFPGGCNDGIKNASPDNDIYLLNSDTILLPNSLFWLKTGLYESDKTGSTGSVTNYASANQMIERKWKSVDDVISFGTKTNVPMDRPYEYRMYLIGFSLLLKRTVLNQTGLLDERFNPGNSEDLDICFRIGQNGFFNVLCRNSFVVHFGSRSFAELQKNGRSFGNILKRNNEKLVRKMQFDPWPELCSAKNWALSKIKEDENSAFSVLELGCGIGSSACRLKTLFPKAEYTGIELDELKAPYARAFGNIITDKNPENKLKENTFDYIIFSSDKEEKITSRFAPYLKSNGQFINNIGGKPVLSISMLCNGKHKTETKKTLESLKTIISRIPSELIIVDTGCDDEMKEIIGKYADKVVPFKWCDDFAKARNAGLKQCSGEWFMFIDDDEWFENTDELVSFFTSGEYKKYYQASYIIRNYFDTAGKDYDDFWGARLCKLTDETHFTGIIHEYITPLIGECKMIHSFVHHYGYAYTNKEEHLAKARRNIKPLLRMIKENPGDIHWRSQLAQEYIAVRDSSKLLDLCDKTLKMLDGIDNPEINRLRGDFYFGKVWADNELFDYDQTIEDFNVYRKDRRNNDICNASLYFSAVFAFFKKKDFKHAINYSHRYMELYLAWKDLPDLSEKLNSNGSLTTRDVFNSRKVAQLIAFLICSGIEIGEADDLHRYFKYLKNLKKDGSQYRFIAGKLIDAIAELPYDERFIGYADELLSYPDIASQCSDHAKELEESDKKEKNGKTAKLIRVLGQTANGRNYYLDYLRLRYEAEYGADEKRLYDRFRALVLMTNDFFNLDDSIWQIALEKGLDIAAVLKQVPLKKWCHVVNTYFDKHDEERVLPVRKMMAAFSDDCDIRFRFFRLKSKEKEIADHKDDFEISDELLKYSKACVDYYKNIYSKEQFESEPLSSMLPPQCQFALNFLKAGEEKSSVKRESLLCDCLGIYEPFDKIVLQCIEREKKKHLFIFLVCKASQWESLDSLWEACDTDPDSRTMVIPIPYYDKNQDGTLGEYHFERDGFPKKCMASYFADVDLKALHPDVIFIADQMDESNPDAAVPAEYYSNVLSGLTKMLILVPPLVMKKPGTGDRVLAQVKEQLKQM
ncbi:MAG: glycosyltransferase [Lachnospiraceae bacterium]|nr:MAG: glycosyltransferase [Lachnospiraceae bacterium]